MNPFLCPVCRASVHESGEFCHRCQSKAESAVVVKVCGWLLVACFVIAAISARSCKGASVEDLRWLAQRESSNDPKAVGKRQELGLYQLRAIAVREVNRLKGTSFKHSDALDPIKAPIIAGYYWDICASRTSRKTREGIHAKYRGAK